MKSLQVVSFIPRPRHNSCRNGMCGNVWFLHGYLDISYVSWDKSKNLCPCGNCTFPSEVHHRNLGSCLVLPRPWWCTSMRNVNTLHRHGFLQYLLTAAPHADRWTHASVNLKHVDGSIMPVGWRWTSNMEKWCQMARRYGDVDQLETAIRLLRPQSVLVKAVVAASASTLTFDSNLDKIVWQMI